jgi:hypothetical protein
MKLSIAKWKAKAGNELTANGLIRVNPNKPEYGSLMLITVVSELSNSYLNTKNKVGFIVGRIADLESMIKAYDLKEGDDFSKKVAPHRIVTLEKLESDLEDTRGWKKKMNPSTGEILTKNDETIMWRTEVVPEGSDVYDAYIKHDTVAVEDEAVKEFSGAAEAIAR